MNITEKTSILVFTSQAARILLKDGYRIIDIKPDKLDPDGKRTIYVFKNDKGLKEKLQTILQENRLNIIKNV